ncbi:cellulose-binding, family II [Treponema primitia ZAS-2]|uniref:Cellulose-binding, family II n=1 Tax=Treponema primitia (strain ATCC BAA-887 / DSM 12427 / ZAS-2) TaxID=545694 RepID=F5YQB4_TREPZ|nr:acyltransferase [Treponema primitia]AEF84534.1 cellulose-binding, family II [Treponema primitia ZAS-2]
MYNETNSIGNTRFDYVDVLRGIAVLGVIAVHTGQHGNITVPDLIKPVINNGQMGVQLFYLTSAFTLFLSLKTRFSHEHFPIRNFFIRRYFRIAPMFYIAIIVYYFGSNQPGITVWNILAHFTFLHGFRPSWINTLVPGGWSVGVEMIFYALMPIIFYKVNNINSATKLLLISIILIPFYVLLSTIISVGDFGYYWYQFFPNQLPLFCLGIIMYFIIIENKSLWEVSKRTLLLLSLCILGLLFTGVGSHVLFGIGFLLFSISLSHDKLKIFVNPFFIYLGKISFSMYLVHFGVLKILTKIKFIDYVNNGIINYIIRFVIVTLIAAIISSVSYNIIEKPFQKIGAKIIKKMER